MRILELGSGANPIPNAVYHDRVAHSPHINIVHDLEVLPWPFLDNEWEEVWAIDVMEHLRLDVDVWLNECWRILMPGGRLQLRLPAWDNPLSYRDPTHRRVFHEASFYYWQPGHELHENFGRYYFGEADRWWNVHSVTRQSSDLRFELGKKVNREVG